MPLVETTGVMNAPQRDQPSIIFILTGDLRRGGVTFARWISAWIRCHKLRHVGINQLETNQLALSRFSRKWRRRETNTPCVWSEVWWNKGAGKFFFHAWSFPYVPFALLPIHHISLWARQLSGAEAYSQFSSPSNCTKYSNSSVKLEHGVEGWRQNVSDCCVLGHNAMLIVNIYTLYHVAVVIVFSLLHSF